MRGRASTQGVNTKLDVLEAETQLARDRNTLTTNLRITEQQRRNWPGCLTSLKTSLRLPRERPWASGSLHCRKASLLLTTIAKNLIN